jgi:F0F1-type ATP synthase assembly protein I
LSLVGFNANSLSILYKNGHLMKANKIYPGLSSWLSRFVLLQLVSAIIAITAFWKAQGQIAALSAVLGSIIGIAPNLVSIGLSFSKTASLSAKKIVFSLYLGEVLKFLICLGLFTLAFQWGKLRPIPLFGTFTATQLAYWWALLIGLR